MALAERTWERVGERKRDRARLIESADYYVTQYQCNMSVTTKEFREFFLYSTIIVYVDVAHACNKRQFLSYFNKLTVETCETTSLPNKYPAPRGLTPQPWLSEIKK